MRNSSAGNFLAFGEDVNSPRSAPPALPLFGRRYHTRPRPCNGVPSHGSRVALVSHAEKPPDASKLGVTVGGHYVLAP
jgi:hypothetical protein